jgi:hypothetical protein
VPDSALWAAFGSLSAALVLPVKVSVDWPACRALHEVTDTLSHTNRTEL